MPGRGAWLHPSHECLTKALTRKAFPRAFKAGRAVSTERLEQQLSELLTRESVSDTSPDVTPDDEPHGVARADELTESGFDAMSNR